MFTRDEIKETLINQGYQAFNNMPDIDSLSDLFYGMRISFLNYDKSKNFVLITTIYTMDIVNAFRIIDELGASDIRRSISKNSFAIWWD